MAQNKRLGFDDVVSVMRGFEGFDEEDYKRAKADIPLPPRTGFLAPLVDYFLGERRIVERGYLRCKTVNASLELYPDSTVNILSIAGDYYFEPGGIYKEGTVWGTAARIIAEKNGVEFEVGEESAWFRKSNISSLSELEKAITGINSSTSTLQSKIRKKAEEIIN